MWFFMGLGLITTSLVTVIILLYIYFGTITYDFWKKLGVPYKKPSLPFFGNLYEAVFSLKSTVQVHTELYNYFKNEKIGGLFSFRSPILLVKDPEMVEAILIKDFFSFHNRGTGADTELDPLAAHLINLEGIKWKKLRQKISPTFTSGKLKGMMPLFVECADKLVERFNYYAENGLIVRCRDIWEKYSTEVMGSSAFGLDLTAMDDPRSNFMDMVKLSASSGSVTKLRVAIRGKLPGLLRLFRWKNQPKVVHDYFLNFVKNAISCREKNNIYRNDFLQLLIDIKKQDLTNSNNLKNEDDEEKPMVFGDKQIIASTYQFLSAGFNTTSLTLTFCTFEIATNQDVQQKMYEEVVQVIKEHGEFSYFAIKDLKYVHQVLSETLRKHPPALVLARKATSDYVLPGTDIVILKGTDILIPIHSLHHDPENFPEPDKFLPERFDDENKDKLMKSTYVPFGVGPRMCIASRFATTSIICGIAKLVYEFKITLSNKTKMPLAFKRTSTFLEPANDVYIELHKRT